MKVLRLLENWDGFISKKLNNRLDALFAIQIINWGNFWVDFLDAR